LLDESSPADGFSLWLFDGLIRDVELDGRGMAIIASDTPVVALMAPAEAVSESR